MKYIGFIICCLWAILPARAQVMGKLVDTGGKAVGFATVSLINQRDSTRRLSVLADEQGMFRFETVAPANYRLMVSNVGFKTWTSALFVINTGQPKYDAGTIELKPSQKQLKEVTIQAKKPMVEMQNGGLSINVQQSLMTRGSTILEVLGRMPGVIVDPQGQGVSLNGKTDITVMLDGRLVRLPIAQVLTMLNSMSADNIEKIELLTTPPAKYDADGSGGIINIVTKKNTKPGTAGSVTATAGYGKGAKASAYAEIYHHTSRVDFTFSSSSSHDAGYGALFANGTENVPIIGGPTTFHYHSISHPVYNFTDAEADIDFRPSGKTTIGAAFYMYTSDPKTNSHNYGNYLLPDSNLIFNSMITGNSTSIYVHPDVYLEQRFNDDEKLNIDMDYLGLNSNSFSNIRSNFTDSVFSPVERNVSDSHINVGVFKSDFSDRFSKKIQLETGIKGTYTGNRSTSAIENFENGQWLIVNAGTANDIQTTESIAAAYAIINWQLDSLTSISAGARYEYSHNGTAHSLNAQYLVNRSLGKLFPDVFFNRKLNSGDALQLSYTERISRPTYSDLASYVSYNDPVSVFTGNPALKPAITQNLKLGYQAGDDIFSLIVSRDIDPILGVQGVTGPTPGLVYLMPENADWQKNIQGQVNIPAKVAAWFDMSYNILGGWHEYHISYFPELLEKAYFSYSVSGTWSFRPGKNYVIEASGHYNSASYYGNSRNDGNARADLGIKKDLGDNRGSLQLSVSDVFRGANYVSLFGALVPDWFDSNVAVSYQGESHSFPIIKLSYFRPFGSSLKKNKKPDSTKEEQQRL